LIPAEVSEDREDKPLVKKPMAC